MPTADEIAAFAVSCASHAVDQLVNFIGDERPRAADRQPEIILMNESNKLGEEDDLSGRRWLLDGAVGLVISALERIGPSSTQPADTPDGEAGEPTIWRIELFVECDDELQVDRLSDAIADAACGGHQDGDQTDHTCVLPWFVVTSALNSANAKPWRLALNR